MFRAVPLPIIRSFPLYIWYWYMSCKFDDRFQAGPGPGISLHDYTEMHVQQNIKFRN